jgi:hypothetical protein
MADSTQIRAEIVTRLLNDAAFLARFLADPDGVLADFPGLDKFDGRYLKDKVTDWASLTAVAQRFGIVVPERPSAAPESPKENPPRLQMVLHLRDDDAFREPLLADRRRLLLLIQAFPKRTRRTFGNGLVVRQPCPG